MPPRPSAVAQGRIAKAAGDLAEAFWETQHDEALRRGLLVHVDHNQPGSTVQGGRVIYVAQGPADYTGVTWQGYSLAAESKSEAGPYFRRSRVELQQAAHLSAVASTSHGIALLLLEFRKEGRAVPERYAVPWAEVPWRVLKTAQSVEEAALSVWRVEPGTCYVERFVQAPPASRVTPLAPPRPTRIFRRD